MANPPGKQPIRLLLGASFGASWFCRMVRLGAECCWEWMLGTL